LLWNLSLAGFNGTIVKWQFSEDGFVTANDLPFNGNPQAITPNFPITTMYSFRAVVQNGICAAANSSATPVVTMYPNTAAGTVSGGTTVCATSNSTLLTLSGNTGTVVRWESSTDNFATNSPISNTTSSYTVNNIGTTTSYRAVVQSGVCPSIPSVATTITVNPTTVAGTTSGGGSYCSGSPITIALTGNTGAITKWQSSADAGATWTDIPFTGSSYTLASTTTSVPVSLQFRAVVGSGVCATANSTVSTVSLFPTTVAGTISGAAPVCATSNATTLTLNGSVGSILRWESSLDNFATAGTVIANTTTSLTTGSLSATTSYRAVVQSGVCASATTPSVTITVSPTTVAGTIPGGATVCSGTNSTLFTLAGNTGTIQWQSSPDGSTWTNVGNTTSSLTATNLTATTYYRAVVTSGGHRQSYFSRRNYCRFNNCMYGYKFYYPYTKWSDRFNNQMAIFD
jgi:hypothetical protein